MYIYHGGNRKAIFGTTTVIGSSTAVTTTSTNDCIRIADGAVSIFQDNNNKAVVNSSGLTVTQGGDEVASFGSTMRIGRDETDESALRVDATGSLSIGTSNTTNITISSAGDITAKNMILEGTVRGDVFTYTYKDLTTSQFVNHYERFTYSSKNYIYFDLGGTLNGAPIEDNAATFYRIEAGAANDHNSVSVGTSAMPIAVLRAPNPRDENNFGIGSLIVFEAANHTVHFKNEINTSVYTQLSHHTAATKIEQNRFSDDYSDTYGPHTDGPGGTYGANTCMAFGSGCRVFVIKNKYGWRIVASSSVTGMEHTVHMANMSIQTTTTNDAYELYVGGDIGATGNVVAYVSDRRLKKDLVKIDNPVEILQKLTGYQFTWNEKAVRNRIGKKDLGLIAQEVEEVLPEAVTDFLHPGDLTIDGTTETYKAVLYDRIVPVLLGGINQLDDELGVVRNESQQQERQIALLKKRVETMETMKYLQSTWTWLENVKKFLKLK
jgi:hypothetical protein